MPDFRAIPSIDLLRQRPAVRDLEERFGAEATISALRSSAAQLRADPRNTSSLGSAEQAAARIEELAIAALDDAFTPSLRAVINATGVILHTNLGRAPLARSAVARIAEIASGYANLEFDLDAGARGKRDVHAQALLCRLTGAEAAVIVNNNAAATLLILTALAAGREAIVSRGELVEIGGGFRVPDVMAQSGAVLREVGTTNRTRAADYGAAISDRTAVMLRVHPSNFRIDGFTERPSLAELVALGRRFSLAVVEDLGSGLLYAGDDHPLRGVEPTVADSVRAGVDVCCFSGDKLLGGPQAGIIVGRRGAIDRIRRHPLMRALRADKMTYAALEATLVEYAAGRERDTVPVQRMLTAPADAIRRRADRLAAAIARMPGWRADVLSGRSAIGGGSAPGVELPTFVVAVQKDGVSAAALDAALRRLRPPIVARIQDDRVVLDLRTVDAADDDVVTHTLTALP